MGDVWTDSFDDRKVSLPPECLSVLTIVGSAFNHHKKVVVTSGHVGRKPLQHLAGLSHCPITQQGQFLCNKEKNVGYMLRY